MNISDFESSKFNYFLHKIADNSFDVSIQNDNLIITQNPATSASALEERVRGVVNYISSQTAPLNSGQIKLIKSIQNNFSSDLQNQDQAVQKTVKLYMEKLAQFIASKSELKANAALKPMPISLQLARVPTNREQFEANLQMVIEHFPRYQLHNDLSVFDSAFQSMPQGYNFDLMHHNLMVEFKKYEQFQIGNLSNLTALKEELVPLLKIPTPVQMSIIIETLPASKDNIAMLLVFVNCISKGIPCVVNRQFFNAQSKNIENFREINLDTEFDIYIQKEGDLCLVLPKGKSLNEWGFRADSLEKSTGQHLKPSGISLNFAPLFINENEKQRFFRLILFSGHGIYPGKPNELDRTQSGDIAGLSTQVFQQTLSVLQDANTAFMMIHTCFGGGTNSEDIHLPQETIPFPIYVASSFDVPSYEASSLTPKNALKLLDDYDRTKVLAEVERMIFPSFPPKAPLRSVPRQITQRDRQRLSQIMDYSDLTSKFLNQGTLFLPTNKSDIPKVAYSLAHPESILDVTTAFRREKGALKADAQEISLVDTQSDRKGYLFTDPIVPCSLRVAGTLPMILLSQGGTNHHVIKEIFAPNHEIEDIARETFNAFHLSKESFSEPAYKIFYIGKLQCKYNMQKAILNRVVIKNTFKEREVLFQIEGESDFHRLIFQAGDSPLYRWRLINSETRSLNEAIWYIYHEAAKSSPSTKAMLQLTAGKQSQEDFLEALDKFFFRDPLPPSLSRKAQLYSAMIRDMLHRPEQALHFKKALRDYKQNMSEASRETILKDLGACWNMASSLKLPLISELIDRTSYTPLMQAAEETNLEQVHSVFHPKGLEEVSVSGSTALLLAIKQKNYEIAKWLLSVGANIIHTNNNNETPFGIACLNASSEFLEWILQNRSSALKGKEGAVAFWNLINAKNWKRVHLLLDNSVGAEHASNDFPLLGLAVDNEADKDILQKLLKYPTVDVNQSVNSQNATPLHRSACTCDLETLKLLLDRGADPNKSTLRKITPLHYVAELGKDRAEELAKALLEKGADPNKSTLRNITPLHFVAEYGKDRAVELAKALLEKGAYIDSQDDEGKTPLHWAITYKNKELIEYLVKRGASLQVEAKNDTNALEIASHIPGLIEFILEIPGQDINPRTCKLDKLFQMAIDKGDANLARLLILHGVNINQPIKTGEPPLLYYLRHKPKDANPMSVIDFFLNYGADLTQKDSQGNTVMDWIWRADKLDVEIVKHLEAAKMPFDKDWNTQENAPMMLDFEEKSWKDKEVDLSMEKGLTYLKRLLSKKYIHSNKGHAIEYILSNIRQSPHSALIYAIQEQADEKFVNLLIDHPYMNLQASDDSEGSPLYWAIQKKNFPIIKRLLSKKAIYIPGDKDIAYHANPLSFLICQVKSEKESLDILEIVKVMMNSGYRDWVNEKSEGVITPLLISVYEGQNPLIEYLIDQGADVNAKVNSTGNTALHLAIIYRCMDQAKLLIEKGADVKVIDNEGNTALHYLLQKTEMKDDQLLPLVALLSQKFARWDIVNKKGISPYALAKKNRLTKALNFMK